MNSFTKNILFYSIISFCAFSAQAQEPAKPYKHTYWVEPGHILAGSYPSANNKHKATKKLGKYLDAGITCFIDLTEKNEKHGRKTKPYKELLKKEAAKRHMNNVEYHRMAIEDHKPPRNQKYMAKILSIINKARAQGKNVYIHCWAGIGRTGTVVGCYLKNKGLSGEQALEQIKALRRIGGSSNRSPRQEKQRQFIKNYSK